MCPNCAGRSGRRRAPPRPSDPSQSQNQEQALPAQEAGPALLPPPTTVNPLEGCLGLLRSLPTIRRCPLVHWVPEQVAQRYAEIRISAVEHLIDAIDARAHPDDIELRSRMALAIPHLLLRYAWEPQTGGNDPQAETPSTQLAAIRSRLAMAEQDQWIPLLLEAWQDEGRKVDELSAMRTGPQRDAHLDATQWETYRQAALAADTGDLRKAKRLLMGMRLLPATTETYDKIVALFPEPNAAEAAFDPHPPIAAVKHPRAPVHAKHVVDFVRSCERQAHAGPAGERNAHISTAMRCPRAANTLARWANLWATAAIPLQARIPWLQMIGIGGDKGGGKARPLVFQETLFKLAAGCISQAEDRKISAQVGTMQFAAGARPGTAQMIWEIESEMATQPNDLFFGLDIENAFGTTRRSDAYLEAIACSTPTAQLQWNMWYGGAQQHVWIQIGNDWRQTTMATGVCQGGCSAKQDFTLAFARAQRTADTKLAAALLHDGTASPTKRLYVDDECLRVPRHVWRPALNAVREGLAEHGYRLRLDKTKAYCPAAQTDAALAAELTADLLGFAEYCPEGLPLLGKVADGEHYTIMTERGPLQGPTTARMEAARALAKGIGALLDAGLDGNTMGPAWKLTSLVLNRALSYDICVSPPDRLRSHTNELDDLVSTLARGMLDPAGVDTQDEWQLSLAQTRRPRQHGGLDLPSATTLAPYAFFGTAIAILPAATHALAQLSMRSPDPPSWDAAVDRALWCLEQAGFVSDAANAQTALATDGVLIDAWGMPTTPGTATLCIRQAARAGIDLRHRRRAWLIRRADLELAALPARVRSHHWTHGGEEGGLGFTANTSSDLVTWDDVEFQINLRRRLRYLHACAAHSTPPRPDRRRSPRWCLPCPDGCVLRPCNPVHDRWRPHKVARCRCGRTCADATASRAARAPRGVRSTVGYSQEDRTTG